MSATIDHTLLPSTPTPPSSPLSDFPPSQDLYYQVLHDVIDAAFPIDEPDNSVPEVQEADATIDAATEPHPSVTDERASLPDEDEALFSFPRLEADEAEEHNPPYDTEDDRSSSSIEGDDCLSDNARSSDEDDSTQSIHNFLNDDLIPSSNPSSMASEESAVFTASQGSHLTADGEIELQQALVDPEGLWVPFGAPDDDDFTASSSDDDDDAASEMDLNPQPSQPSHGGSPAPASPTTTEKPCEAASTSGTKGKQRCRSRSPEPEQDEYEYYSDFEDIVKGLPSSHQPNNGCGASSSTGPANILKKPRLHNNCSAPGPSVPQHNLGPVRVVCKWQHDDSNSQPLSTWTHQDAPNVQQGKSRFLDARRLSDGEIQLRHPVGRAWTPSWRFELRRPALPPQCDGCLSDDL